ncbi:NAD-binding protein [Mycena venus]|uniref:NAD-binding protein n=1 Tax=Mycena venus TaxID=2733690 RepID=A0A8H6Z1S6_9AGAR|nr:NAD-binding protein [Mycena venus]
MSSKGIALVTGAGKNTFPILTLSLISPPAQGIGRGVALRLAEDGFEVAVNDVAANSANLDSLVAEIKQKGRESSKHIADVSQDEQVKVMVEEVVKQHGSLDVMVANAGILGPEGPLTEISAEQYDRVMSVNARGPFFCYKYAGIQMIKQGRGGRMIGASSLAGKRGIGPLTAYSMSKFAVRGLTQAAAQEFAPHGITVNAYAPGGIDTPMMIGNRDRTERMEEAKQMSPLKLVGVPADIASLVSFLASAESRFITGQTMSIDGGAFFD